MSLGLSYRTLTSNGLLPLCAALGLSLALGACRDDGPPPGEPDAPPAATLDDMLAEVIAAEGLMALPDKPALDTALVSLGQALFFDKELSGNRDIACATCHHPDFMVGDGLSLSIGTGGTGLGTDREISVGRTLVPRNAPEIFNRGYDMWNTMFWDSRVNGAPGNFTTPAGLDLLASVDSLLGAQAMFPPTSRDEMRGAVGDYDVNGNLNELAEIDDARITDIWTGITTRLMAIPEYQVMFEAAYPGVDLGDIDFGHAANAIGAFEADAFTFTESPWDRYLRGEMTAMTDSAKRGALVFYGKAGCGGCHSGSLFTDQEHHVVAAPQLGPGKGPAAPDDFGRLGITGDDADKYAFRTPPLRNVTLTGPWFHAGSYTTLEGAVRHYLDAAGALESYDVTQLTPEMQAVYHDDAAAIADRIARLDQDLLAPIELTTEEFDDLMAFLGALTDPAAEDLSGTIPANVPSGLTVD